MSSTKFIHLADVHLGKRQYNLTQRYYDYFKAFNSVLKKAIEQEVDFVLVSGDLIDSDERIGPALLKDIITSIKSFQSESNDKLGRKIPIICIEGNHENPFYTDYTWLKILADLDLLVLLSGSYDNKKETISFEEYSSDSRFGGKITVKNCTIYGMKYFGTATFELFPFLTKAIPKSETQFNILMMHFGISQYDERKAGVDLSPPLDELRQKVDYLALGHFHSQYMIPQKKPWIFNPGSLEVNDVDETFKDRGVFLVEAFENKTVQVRPLLCENGIASDELSISNRRFLVVNDVNISGINSFPEAQEFVLDRLKKYGVRLKSEQCLPRENLDLPILYFTIRGIIGYSELEVDMSTLRKQILETFDVLGLRLSNKLVSTMDQEIALDSELSIAEIEKEVFLNTVVSETQFSPYSTTIFEMFSELKQQIDTKNPNYKKIGDRLQAWITSDQAMYDEFLSVLKHKKTEKKPPSTKKKKVTKSKGKAKVAKEKEEELDLSEIDYSDLLEGDESGFDDLIDDEEWE